MIQTAINATTNGDTVLVYAGTYTENINYNGKNIVVGSLYLTTADTSYISSTIIDGDSSGSVVTFWGQESSNALLQGFTITNGNYDDGGGIYCRENSSPTLKNLIIKNNTVSQDGGGIYCYDNADPVIQSVILSNNSAGSDGGAIFCSVNSTITIKNSILKNNVAAQKGGAVFIYDDTLNIVSSLVVDNTTNWSSNNGGAIHAQTDAVLNITNVTIYGNSKSGIFHENSDITSNITNSIIYGNTEEQIGNYQYGTTVNLHYSIVDYYYCNDDANGGETYSFVDCEGNIIADPLLTDPDNGDYHLSDYSPAIGAGTATGAPTTDITGVLNSRPMPSGSNPDMGAYENSNASASTNSFFSYIYHN